MDRLLDNARRGPLCLRMPEIAEIVVQAIRYRDQADYDLHHWVVMANYVHLLIRPQIPVSRLVQSLKRFTAREANKALCLTGAPFWQDAVNAGLAQQPEDFPWSSARPIDNRPAG